MHDHVGMAEGALERIAEIELGDLLLADRIHPHETARMHGELVELGQHAELV